MRRCRPAWNQPHARREHPASNSCMMSCPGSAPHTRGAHRDRDAAGRGQPRTRGEHPTPLTAKGSEVRWDQPHTRGSATTSVSRVRSSRDQTRTRGEHWRGLLMQQPQPGPVPHLRGTRSSVATLPTSRGPAPYPRGAHRHSSAHVRGGGTSPVPAGSTFRSAFLLVLRRDQPRMCGEHSRCRPASSTHGGPAPYPQG